MLRQYGPYNSGAAVGDPGVATANADTSVAINGWIKAVYVKYNDTPPATTDVTIKTKGTSPAAPSQAILTVTDANSSGWFFPRPQIHTTAGAAVAAQYTPEGVPVFDLVNVKIDQANVGDNVDVWLIVER